MPSDLHAGGRSQPGRRTREATEGRLTSPELHSEVIPFRGTLVLYISSPPPNILKAFRNFLKRVLKIIQCFPEKVKLYLFYVLSEDREIINFTHESVSFNYPDCLLSRHAS